MKYIWFIMMILLAGFCFFCCFGRIKTDSRGEWSSRWGRCKLACTWPRGPAGARSASGWPARLVRDLEDRIVSGGAAVSWSWWLARLLLSRAGPQMPCLFSYWTALQNQTDLKKFLVFFLWIIKFSILNWIFFLLFIY